jgi:hypothetical protein
MFFYYFGNVFMENGVMLKWLMKEMWCKAVEPDQLSQDRSSEELLSKW